MIANQEEWKIPIKAELDSLLEEKKALKPLSPEEKKEFFRKAAEEGREVEVVPGKLVPTIKPAPGGGKKKARVVACGNFTAKDAQDDLYAGTGDVVTFRMMLQCAAEMGWEGVTMDIRTAFLNTPWDDEDVLVKPPALLVRMVIEGLMVGESVAALVQEIEPRVPKHMITDSQAVVGMCVSEGGSWRTRHLRLRAAHAKQRFTRGDWLLKHRGGEDMLADIGTKPLQASRMAYLKQGLNMGKLEIEAEEKNEGEDEGEKKGSSTEDVERILKMIVCMAMVRGAEAQGEGSEGWTWELRVVAMVVLLALVGVIAVVAQVAKTIKGWVKKPEPEEEPQEEPIEPITPRNHTQRTNIPDPYTRATDQRKKVHLCGKDTTKWKRTKITRKW